MSNEGDFEKLINNGEVAVVYSPGYGGGWSTWNKEHAERLAMDKDIAQAVLDGNKNKAVKIALALFPKIYTGGGDRLDVAWVPQGAQFIIHEYDGYESVEVAPFSGVMTA